MAVRVLGRKQKEGGRTNTDERDRRGGGGSWSWPTGGNRRKQGNDGGGVLAWLPAANEMVFEGVKSPEKEKMVASRVA
jgi:hypothetical protein